MSIPATVRIQVPIAFPAQVNPGAGLAIAKANGIYTVSLNFGGLGQIGGSGIADPGSKGIAIFDTITGVYNFMTLTGFGDALFKLTSTTSLTIGAGSFTFATQPNKSVAVGSWVTATSNANVANFLNGQVTAYDSLGNLTISVPTSGVGGSGTKADWTIRPSSIPPAIATVGAQAGASYTYVLGDQAVIKKRSNAGAPMVDTLPGTAPGVLATGWLTRVVNSDAAGILAIGVGVGTLLDGNGPGFYIYLGPGQGATIVSDGANYFAIDKPTRCRLVANTTIFYGGAGSSDSNAGLTSLAGAFANGQTALNFVRDRIDGNTKQVVVKAADGTYTQPLQLFDLVGFDNGAWNPPSVVLRGNTVTPANVLLSVTAAGANCITGVNNHTSWFIEGFKFTTSGAANTLVESDYGGTIYLGTNEYGSAVAHQIQGVNAASRIELVAPYTVSGSAGGGHWVFTWGGEIVGQSLLVTLVGNPTFGNGWAVGAPGGSFLVSSVTYSGATGAGSAKYLFDQSTLCSVDPSTFPGTLPGVVTNQTFGTSSNDVATAGKVGELLQSTVAPAGVALTNNVGANMTSLALTPGDWDVWLHMVFNGVIATTVNYLQAGIGPTSGALVGVNGDQQVTIPDTGRALFSNASSCSVLVGPVQLRLSATTTYFAVAVAGFGASTLSVSGKLQARRRR